MTLENTILNTSSNTSTLRTLVCLLLTTSALPASAALIPVTTTDMVVADDGLCSLPEAIVSANTGTSSGSMPGECPAGTTDDVIELQDSADYTLTSVLSSDVDGDNGLPILTKPSTTIEGHGATLARDPKAPDFRLLKITGSQVTLSNLRFENGRSDFEGGAVLSTTGVTVEGSTFVRNQADLGGGIVGRGQSLTVRDSNFLLNSAETWGGGVYNRAGLGIVERCSFTANDITGNGSGAGVGGHSVELRVIDSTFRGNQGGAVQHGTGELLIDSSVFIDNSGSYTVFGDTNAHLKLINSTLTDNFHGLSTAFAIVRVVNTGEINNSSIFDNLSTALTANNPAAVSISNSILVNDFPDTLDCNGDFDSLGYNIDSDGSCGFDNIGDLTAEPLLVMRDLLEDKPYLEPMPGSPAIEGGSPAAPGSGSGACETTDQNGTARPIDGDADGAAACDIGAVEAPHRLFEDGFESGDLTAWASP